MGTFVVEGGKPLSGTIEPQGAKNEALQILCAVLLTAEPVEITNVPDIVDINKLLDILQSLGVRIEKKGKQPLPLSSRSSEFAVSQIRCI